MKRVFIAASIALTIILIIFFLRPSVTDTSDNHIDGSIVFDGIERTYHLYIPDSYSPGKPVPLLIVLHGGGGTGRDMEFKTTHEGFDRLADKENFIVVYPDASKRHWNDGRLSHDIDACKVI